MSEHPHILRFAQVLVASSLLLSGWIFAADFPVGTFSIDAAKPNLSFDGKGTFKVAQGDEPLVSGTYAAKGDRVVLTDLKGPWACTEAGEQTGSYRWTYDGSALTFNKISDSCKDRVASLEGTKWTKQP